MEDIAVTNLVPAVEEPEIISSLTMGPGPAEPAATDGSAGGDGSEASCLWSLTHEQQVQNLKENWKRAFTWHEVGIIFGDEFETNPWFASVVEKLRTDPCLDSCKFEMDQLFRRGLKTGLRMTSLDAAILMRDLKMVQKILERSSDRDELVHGSPSDPMRASWEFRYKFSTTTPPTRTYFFYTPLHLAVVGEDSHIVDVLLEEGADVNAQNWLRLTPLDFACKMGSVDMLLKLLEKDEEKKKHPLHVVVRHGDIDFMKKLPSLNVNALDYMKRTPLHYLATKLFQSYDDIKNLLKYLAKDGTLDLKALDDNHFSAFYVAILYCNTPLVIALLDSFKEQLRLNEACNKDFGPPIQIAFEGGRIFQDIQSALMECDSVKSYMERLYRDRQVYVDAANAILVGAALIASVTFASWLQPPLSYTSYFSEGSSSFVPSPSTSNLDYVDVEHNIALRAFWIFNALSFYFAIATVVCGARSVLPKSYLFIKKIVEKLRTNLLVTSILLACSVLFVIIAFAIAGTIVLTPLLKYQWYMIVPTIIGGTVCIISLVFLIKSMSENYIQRHFDEQWNFDSTKEKVSFLEDIGY